MMKKCFAHVLCSFGMLLFFSTALYSMEQKEIQEGEQNLSFLHDGSHDDIDNIIHEISSLHDNINKISTEQENSGLLINNEDESLLESHAEEETFTIKASTIEDVITLTSEEFENMPPKKAKQVSKILCEYVKKALEMIPKDFPKKDMNTLNVCLSLLKQPENNTQSTTRNSISTIVKSVDPKILNLIILQLSTMIQSIENALNKIDNEIKEKEISDKQNSTEDDSACSTLKSKQSRLRCLLAVLKPSFLILTVGVVAGYTLGWLPENVSESVQAFFVSTLKKWFF